MRRKILSFLIISTLIFAFIIFYKGLNKSSFYEPKSEIKDIPQFSSKSFYLKKEIDSKKFLVRTNIIFLIYGLLGVCHVEMSIPY